MSAASPDILIDEISEYFLSRITPEEIIAFKPSQALDDRLHNLLDRNSDDTITPDERKELDRFLQVSHLFNLLKAKARLKLANS